MTSIPLNSPIVRAAAQVAGAVGGVALVNVLLGTTAIVTTSYLATVLCYLAWAVAYMAAALLGAHAAGYVSDKAFGTAGTSVGKSINAVRSLFSRTA